MNNFDRYELWLANHSERQFKVLVLLMSIVMLTIPLLVVIAYRFEGTLPAALEAILRNEVFIKDNAIAAFVGIMSFIFLANLLWNVALAYTLAWLVTLVIAFFWVAMWMFAYSIMSTWFLVIPVEPVGGATHVEAFFAFMVVGGLFILFYARLTMHMITQLYKRA